MTGALVIAGLLFLVLAGLALAVSLHHSADTGNMVNATRRGAEVAAYAMLGWTLGLVGLILLAVALLRRVIAWVS